MNEERLLTEARQQAGHYEILGETYAKFEFFENGWNPYTRFLDVDKVDLILRSGRTTEKESIARFKSSLESCIRLARCGSVSFLISPHRDSSKKMSLLARSTKVIFSLHIFLLATSDTTEIFSFSPFETSHG